MKDTTEFRWDEHAACTDDPEVMFPPRGDKKAVDAAKAVCATCPVIRACLIDALRGEGNATRQSRFGVRGGATPTQRRALYEKYRPADAAKQAEDGAKRMGNIRNLAPCGTAAAYRRHHRKGEPPCRPCRDADLRRKQDNAAKKKTTPAPCGTRGGYRAHRARGEQACDPCRAANTAADRRLRETGSSKNLTTA